MPKVKTMANLLKQRRLEEENIPELLRELRPLVPISPQVFATVRRIIDDVAANGDKALLKYTELFDKTPLTTEELQVSREEIQEAYSKVSRGEVQALKKAKARIEELDRLTLRRAQGPSWIQSGIKVRTVLTPIESVGCYVPGGRASYPSTLLMTAVPARTAGVKRIVACTPPPGGKTLNPLLLVASDLCGVKELYRMGGAQGIAALAYGTETVRPVAKIVGPGNMYVAAAKLSVLDRVAIDLPAGPSEALIIADGDADPQIVARDMICQAEHGSESVCGLVTNSERLAKGVMDLVPKMLKSIERREVVSQSLGTRGFILVCRDLEQAAAFADAFAPEHLEIMAADAGDLASRVHTAGLILLGEYSPAAATDYCVGTNHVLPTGGFGRVYSGLSVLDYVRRCNVVECSRRGLKEIAGAVEILAEREGLPNHAEAVRERFRVAT